MFSYPTPFTPPTTEDDRLSWLRLIRSRRVGIATFYRLMDEYGSAHAALQALPDIAKAAGDKAYTACPEGVARAEIKAGKATGARLLCRGAPGYPKALAEISDAPPLLWYRGDVSLLGRPMVAMVGARNASSLGTRMARKLAAGLAEAGVTIVSGLARGIDTAAHIASLERGTIAVMAGGVDVIYPAENAGLAEEIAKQGLILSEQPIGQEPQARHFPLRNRIISGLSQVVLVVEAAARSGSLITARCALDQGRDVLSVPGHPFDGRASGCNMLIRDGATLVRGPEDVLEILNLAAAVERSERPVAETRAIAPNAVPRSDPAGDSSEPATGWRREAALHSQILDRLGPSPIAEDQLIRDLQVPSATLASELLTLEMDGRITRLAGGLVARQN